MFVEVIQKEKICAGSVKQNMKEVLIEIIQKKIAGKRIGNIGMLLFPLKISSVYNADIHDGLVYPMVEYTAMAYKVYIGEILICKIERQSKEGIMLSHNIISWVFVSSAQIPKPSFLTAITGRTGTYAETWVWKYNDVSLYVRTGEMCRVRVIGIEKGKPVYATIASSGLGPITWW